MKVVKFKPFLLMSILAASVVLLSAGCATTVEMSGGDPEIERLTKLAMDAYERGSIEPAAQLYRRALKRARGINDPYEIGAASYNLAACMIILGRAQDAKPLLEEARLELREVGQGVAEVMLLEAEVARLMGQHDRAADLAGALTVELGKKAKDREYALMHLLKADIACDQSAVARAEQELELAAKYITKINNPALEAELANVQGRIFLIQGRPEDAAPEFDKETTLLQDAGKYREMALASGRAAMAYRDSGQAQVAAERFFEAARSLFSQGDLSAALRMIEPAVSTAEKAGDDTTVQRTVQLFTEIKGAVKDELDE